MNFSGQSVLVIGAKRSGFAAAELLRNRGANVRVMDSQELPAEERARFDLLDVPVVRQTDENIAPGGQLPDIAVVSPGVPLDVPLVVSIRKMGIPIIGEVELASYFLKGPIIGITGSNGKTTTTALTGHLLKEGGVPCQVGGNIGTPVTKLVDSSNDGEWNVLELSSFQLETVFHFRAQIAACLNLTPDHLDRHHTLENYAAAKARLFETQPSGSIAVLNYEDPNCHDLVRRTKAEVYWFSSSQKVPSGIWLDDSRLLFNGRILFNQNRIKLHGAHNLENVMAAALIAVLAGAEMDSLGMAVESFPGVEHRLEFVRELQGVQYYNDSKATNVDATLKAVNAFNGGLWVILGGKDKGGSYEPLRQALAERAKAALLIGAGPPYPHASGPRIRKDLGKAVKLVDCGTLAKAVAYARKHAKLGDVVLLSPACASFDQFENYEERGREFKRLVARLF